MPEGKSHLIQIDPIDRLYRVKQLISFPGITEILFLFQRTQAKDNQTSDDAGSKSGDSDSSKNHVKGTSAGQ